MSEDPAVPGLYTYEVGKLYNPTKTSWPETPSLRITNKGIELGLFYRHPTQNEILTWRKGQLRFAWVPGDNISFLCYKAGNDPWADTPYEVHREAAEEQGWVATWEPERFHVVTIMLVDASNGILRAARLVTWPSRFADAVRDNLVRQLAMEYSPTAAKAAFTRIYAAYTSEKLAKERAVVTCTIPSRLED